MSNQHQHVSDFAKFGYLLTWSTYAQFETARTFPHTISTTFTKHVLGAHVGVAQSVKSTGIPRCTAHGMFVAIVTRAIICGIRWIHIGSIWIVTSRARKWPKYLVGKEIGQECEPRGF